MRVDFIIDGAAVGAASGATFNGRDPVTGRRRERSGGGERSRRRQGRRGGASRLPGLVGDGPERAARACSSRRRTFSRRVRADFAKAMTEEIGATGPWGGFNVHFAASLLREAAALTTQITGEIIPADKPGVLSMAVRQPAGVVLGIAPWNAPVILGVRAIAAPLACGNTRRSCAPQKFARRPTA